MKIISKIAMFLVGAAAFASCNGPDKTIVDPANVQPPIFISYPTAKIVLDRNQPDVSQVAFGWKAAKYGYSAAVTYTLYAYTSQEDGAPMVEIGQTTNNSLAINNKTLNSALINGLKALPTKECKFDVQLVCSIGAEQFDTISLPIQVNVTPYSMDPIPLYVVGDYCGWSHANATAIYSELANEIYTGWVYMSKEGVAVDDPTPFKFCTQLNWDGPNYGGTLEALSTDGGASNIEIPSGYTNLFTVDVPKLKATIDKKFKRLGMVGDATPNAWNSPDTELKYDAENKYFKATGVAMKAGEFKFRCDDDWKVCDWGATDTPGKLLRAGGGTGNIKFDKADGTYTVIVRLLDAYPTYEFIAE